jgi:hypothetical protein
LKYTGVKGIDEYIKYPQFFEKSRNKIYFKKYASLALINDENENIKEGSFVKMGLAFSQSCTTTNTSAANTTTCINPGADIIFDIQKNDFANKVIQSQRELKQ